MWFLTYPYLNDKELAPLSEHVYRNSGIEQEKALREWISGEYPHIHVNRWLWLTNADLGCFLM